MRRARCSDHVVTDKDSKIQTPVGFDETRGGSKRICDEQKHPKRLKKSLLHHTASFILRLHALFKLFFPQPINCLTTTTAQASMKPFRSTQLLGTNACRPPMQDLSLAGNRMIFLQCIHLYVKVLYG